MKQGVACVCASLLFSLALEFSNQVAARGNVSPGHHTKASPVFLSSHAAKIPSNMHFSVLKAIVKYRVISIFLFYFVDKDMT